MLPFDIQKGMIHSEEKFKFKHACFNTTQMNIEKNVIKIAWKSSILHCTLH